MAYFDFNYITDPPDDELVDEVTQLNNNWDELETKLKPFNETPSDFTGITVPKGTWAFDPDPGEGHRLAVWNGTNWYNCLNPNSVKTGWQTIPLRSPVVARTGYTLKANIDIMSRRVILMGGVQLNATADAWVLGTTYEITGDAGIQPELAPANAAFTSIQQGAVGQITTASGFASAVVWVEKRASPSRTAVMVRYQGNSGGGNFIMLDGIEWWY